MLTTTQNTYAIQITIDSRYNTISLYDDRYNRSYNISKKTFNRIMRQLSDYFTPAIDHSVKGITLYHFNYSKTEEKYISED